MAASAWAINKYAKLKIGQGIIDLSAVLFRLSLHTSAASANIAGDISILGSVGSEVTGGGYTAGGERLSATTWALSGNNAKFDSTAKIYTGSIANIRYAYIVYSAAASTNAAHLVCWSALSTSPFSVTGTNTLTVTPNASGIFVLS